MINENNVAFGQGLASHGNHRDLLSAIGSLCGIGCSQAPTEGQRSLPRGKAAGCVAPQGSTCPCLGTAACIWSEQGARCLHQPSDPQGCCLPPVDKHPPSWHS